MSEMRSNERILGIACLVAAACLAIWSLALGLIQDYVPAFAWLVPVGIVALVDAWASRKPKGQLGNVRRVADV